MQSRTEKWVKIGEGNYNRVYLNETKTLIMKIPKTDSRMDDPERSVRLWNLINSDIQPPAQVLKTIDPMTGGTVLAWTCPYIKGVQASYEEIAEALINIYNRTGRIVTDAPSEENFVRTADGKIVCVDIGWALQLDRRRKSLMSLWYWEVSKGCQSFSEYFENDFFTEHYSNTINTIKALLFVKAYRPNINVSFLKTNKKLTQELAKQYTNQIKETLPHRLDILDEAIKRSVKDAQLIPYLNSEEKQGNKEKKEELALSSSEMDNEAILTKDGEKEVSPPIVSLPSSDEEDKSESSQLAQYEHLTLDSVDHVVERKGSFDCKQVRQTCIDRLNAYILSRGYYNKKGKYELSYSSSLFRTKDLTLKKVTEAMKLISELSKMENTLEQMQMNLDQSFLQYPEENTGLLRKAGFASSINDCLKLVSAELEKNKKSFQNRKVG